MLPQERREGHQGSSPLARGLREGPRFRGPQARIIPARAGFTSSPFNVLFTIVGSSPLARGLPTTGPSALHEPRIIPARAGFTLRPSTRLTVRTDHPRSRGVYFRFTWEPNWFMGSSPLARGLPAALGLSLLEVRIIPARAGFTYGPGNEPGPSWDHPRSRGVYRTCLLRPLKAGGSSPLARGLRADLPVLADVVRIIPARAGFT